MDRFGTSPDVEFWPGRRLASKNKSGATTIASVFVRGRQMNGCQHNGIHSEPRRGDPCLLDDCQGDVTMSTAAPPSRKPRKKRPHVRREDVPSDVALCSYCTAKCCRYFALPIEAPDDWDDFDHMRWYVMHGRTAIFVDDEVWYLMVYGDCENLLPDFRCGIYETRPKLCGEYSSSNCEYDNDGSYDRFFETAEQLWEYAEATLPPRKWDRPETHSIPMLPVLGRTPQ